MEPRKPGQAGSQPTKRDRPDKGECPVCYLPVRVTEDHLLYELEYTCRVCGQFRMSALNTRGWRNWWPSVAAEKRQALSVALRRASDEGESLSLSPMRVEMIVKTFTG